MKRSATASKKTKVKSGYVVEEFDLTVSGYGNLMEERITAAQAIKHFCVECQGGHYFPWRDADDKVIPRCIPLDQVEACSSTTCWLHGYRLGHRPTRAK